MPFHSQWGFAAPYCKASGGYINVALAFAAATPATVVGDTVTNPTTGVDATVVALVESVKVNLTIDIGADPAIAPTVTNVVLDESSGFDTVPADKVGDPAGTDFTPNAAGSGPIKENSTGSTGAGGSDAYGLEICIPGIGCAKIGKKGSDGKDGGTGPTVNRTVLTSHGGITATSSGQAGIEVTSTGGDGGDGGGSYGNFGPYSGGSGGTAILGTVDLAGEINLTLLNPQKILSGDFTKGLFSAEQGAPSGVDPMRVSLDLGQTLFRAQTGIDFSLKENLSLRVQYSSVMHDRIDIRSGKVKLSFPF